jgi:hypothetical protein
MGRIFEELFVENFPKIFSIKFLYQIFENSITFV